MTQFVNVAGARLPIYIKEDKIVVKMLNGKEHVLFEHNDKYYLQYELDSYLTCGLTIREQALIIYEDK